MKQEPVALVSVMFSNEPYTFSQLKTLPNGTHELYTAPRELSNEEIASVYKEVFNWDVKESDRNWVGLARALLKKASEKC